LRIETQLKLLQCDTEESIFHLIRVLKEISLLPKNARLARASCVPIFPQYDNDERPLIAIKEVVDLYERFFKEIPHILYFIHPLPEFTQINHFIRIKVRQQDIEYLQNGTYRIAIDQLKLFNILLELLAPVSQFCKSSLISPYLALSEILKYYVNDEMQFLILKELDALPYFYLN
jgi:hypothetical protein